MKRTVALFIAVLLGISTLMTGCGSSSGTNSEHALITGRTTKDNIAYIPQTNGTMIVIEDQVDSAVMTKDGRHIVVLLTDGTIYVTDKNLSSKNVIASDGLSILETRNDGFLYENTEKTTFRVLYNDSSVIELGRTTAISVAKGTATALYALDDGGVYILSSDSNEEEKIGTYNGDVTTKDISDDASLAVWSAPSGNVWNIFAYSGGTNTKLWDVDSQYATTYVSFSADQRLMTVSNQYCDTMWFVTPDTEPVSARIGGDGAESSVYTSSGSLSDLNASKISEVYVAVDGDSGNNIYCISRTGDRDRLIDNVYDFTIVDGKLFYRNADGGLYYATINKTRLSDSTKIANGVNSFQVSKDGAYVYYMRDCQYSSQSGVLYSFRVKDNTAQKVSSDAFIYVFGATYSMYLMILNHGINGDTLYFFEDAEEIGGNGDRIGTLMKWTFGDKSPERISNDVLILSERSSYNALGVIEPKNMFYLKYSSLASNGTIYVDWMHYNGKDSVRLAEDITI